MRIRPWSFRAGCRLRCRPFSASCAGSARRSRSLSRSGSAALRVCGQPRPHRGGTPRGTVSTWQHTFTVKTDLHRSDVIQTGGSPECRPNGYRNNTVGALKIDELTLVESHRSFRGTSKSPDSPVRFNARSGPSTDDVDLIPESRPEPWLREFDAHGVGSLVEVVAAGLLLPGKTAADCLAQTSPMLKSSTPTTLRSGTG